MRTSPVPTLAASLLLVFAVGCQSEPKSAMERDEMRADLRRMSEETLNRLYAAQPEARRAVEKAAGHAVFSNFGMKILVAGSGNGAGLAFDHSSSGNPVYMRMVELSAGLGMGVKKFRL